VQGPSFSVLIPVYQAAETVAETVASALAQTRPAREVIVCDDGSTDDLAAALAPYTDRIVLVRQENAGGAAAANKAMRHSTGDFVAVLDADDVYSPSRFEALAALSATRPELDLLATDAYFEQNRQIVGQFYDAHAFPEEDDQRRAVLEWCFMFSPAVRRSRLLEIGGFDELLRIGYDWDCWLRLILGGSRAGLVDKPLVRYRLVSGSLSDDRPASFRERVTVLEKAASNPDLRPGERPFLERQLVEAGRRALQAEAREALLWRRADARRQAFRVLRGPGMSAGARLKAALAVASPRLAGRALRRREAGEKERFPSVGH
jgi:glycosyltransferase involved in cell wall biosynthesis